MKRLFNSLVALAALLTMAGCAREEKRASQARGEEPVPVRVFEAAAQPFADFVEVAGTVQAKMRAVIEAKTSGRIRSIPARMGARVKKDDLLVQIDAAELQARVDQAAAARIQAESDLKRATGLFQQQALTRSEFDAAQARFSVADAALREAESLFGYTQVRAPFDGVVVRRLAEAGDLAAPGKPLLELENPAEMRFMAEIPEALIGQVHLGEHLPVSIPGSAPQLKGRVVEVAPGGDPISRSSRVELEIPSTGLRSGTFGRLLLPAGSRETLSVPHESLVTRGQMDILFVLRTNRAEMRLVRTGRQIESRVEILAGLSPGERVILDPKTVRDGQQVSLP